MPLDNCKRCGSLFQRTVGPLCRDCQALEQTQITEMYRYIHRNPGVSIETLSETFKMPVRDIEELVFSGVLGTANQLISTQCALCKCEMSYVNRIGYFCYKCNEVVEKNAGIQKGTPDEQKVQNILDGVSGNGPHTSEKPSQPPGGASSRSPMRAKYGFKRLSQ